MPKDRRQCLCCQAEETYSEKYVEIFLSYVNELKKSNDASFGSKYWLTHGLYYLVYIPVSYAFVYTMTAKMGYYIDYNCIDLTPSGGYYRLVDDVYPGMDLQYLQTPCVDDDFFVLKLN